MRCPRCAARNAENAPWCTQCYASFQPAEAGTHAPAAPDPDAPATPPPPDPTGAPPPPPPGDGTDRDIRLRDEVVEWRCGACGAWSPLTSSDCATCATPRSGFGPTDRAAAARPAAVALGPALVASALLPGLGHLLRGQIGTGVARVLLWALWAGSGLAVVVSAGLTPGGVVLLLAGAALWAVSLVDLQRQAAGRPQVAEGRVLAWSVLGVTLLLVGAVLVGTVGQGGP